ncbi:MAG: hypothetical protein JF599_06575 [Verrucomicrobia bacterium]|nr:hypothetical protein [Verrucomicrobiota bacterium]
MHPRVKNYLIILLAFSTATGGVIAWQQTQRLNNLRASLLTARPAPAARAIAAAKSSDDSPKPAAAAQAKPADEVASAADNAAPPRQPRNTRPNLTAMLANPEFAKAWNLQQRAQLDNRFAGLFKQLNLSPDQLDKLKGLLVERQTTAMDVYAAAREKGVNPGQNREEIQKMVSDSQAEVDQSIRTTLGDTAYQQYQNYQNTQPQRTVVSQLDQRLSYSASPLTTAQTEFLVQALASTSPTATTGGGPDQLPAPGGPFGRSGANVPITDAVIQQAQGVLTPSQLDALRQLQAEQQAQLKLGQLFRAQQQQQRGK